VEAGLAGLDGDGERKSKLKGEETTVLTRFFDAHHAGDMAKGWLNPNAI